MHAILTDADEVDLLKIFINIAENPCVDKYTQLSKYHLSTKFYNYKILTQAGFDTVDYRTRNDKIFYSGLCLQNFYSVDKSHAHGDDSKTDENFSSCFNIPDKHLRAYDDSILGTLGSQLKQAITNADIAFRKINYNGHFAVDHSTIATDSTVNHDAKCDNVELQFSLLEEHTIKLLNKYDVLESNTVITGF